MISFIELIILMCEIFNESVLVLSFPFCKWAKQDPKSWKWVALGFIANKDRVWIWFCVILNFILFTTTLDCQILPFFSLWMIKKLPLIACHFKKTSPKVEKNVKKICLKGILIGRILTILSSLHSLELLTKDLVNQCYHPSHGQWNGKWAWRIRGFGQGVTCLCFRFQWWQELGWVE